MPTPFAVPPLTWLAAEAGNLAPLLAQVTGGEVVAQREPSATSHGTEGLVVDPDERLAEHRIEDRLMRVREEVAGEHLDDQAKEIRRRLDEVPPIRVK